MDIAVLIKQVPDTTAKISISGDVVDEESVGKWSISPYDEYALESALQLKDAASGEVVAITCGPNRASKALTEAAAVGADRLIHVVVDNVNMDSTQLQKLLATAIEKSGCKTIICGKQAADTNSGSTGPGLARILDATLVGMVSDISFEGSDLIATRSGLSGAEKVVVSPPCVFTFDKGTRELRRPNVRGIMMAKKKEIESISSSDLGLELGESSVSLSSHSAPPEKPPGQKFEGADSISTVVRKLREEANVI